MIEYHHLLVVAYQTIVESEVSDHRGENKIAKSQDIIHSFSFILLTQEAIWMRNKNGYEIARSRSCVYKLKFANQIS